jgi:ArsR family transcriptional regulator
MQPLHKILRALADPNRLRILNLLLAEPLCVCELEMLLGLPQPLLSRHLAYLRGAGLVLDRRIGARVQYSLAEGPEAFNRMKQCLEGVLSSEEVYREDRQRLLEWRGGCCSAREAAPEVSAGRILTKGA